MCVCIYDFFFIAIARSQAGKHCLLPWPSLLPVHLGSVTEGLNSIPPLSWFLLHHSPSFLPIEPAFSLLILTSASKSAPPPHLKTPSFSLCSPLATSLPPFLVSLSTSRAVQSQELELRPWKLLLLRTLWFPSCQTPQTVWPLQHSTASTALLPKSPSSLTPLAEVASHLLLLSSSLLTRTPLSPSKNKNTFISFPFREGWQDNSSSQGDRNGGCHLTASGPPGKLLKQRRT